MTSEREASKNTGNCEFMYIDFCKQNKTEQLKGGFIFNSVSLE